MDNQFWLACYETFSFKQERMFCAIRHILNKQQDEKRNNLATAVNFIYLMTNRVCTIHVLIINDEHKCMHYSCIDSKSFAKLELLLSK